MANKRRTRRKVHKSIAKTSGERGYVTLAGSGITPSDWNPALIGEDADIWMSAYMLTARMRDLFRSNPVYVKYRELLWSNIFGENGIMLRMKIKETEDRVVHTPDEARALLAYEKRINRIRDWAAKQDGRTAEHYRAFSLADQMERSSVDAIVRGKATIQAGSPDVFANLMVERAWAEWQRAENCDIRGKRNYHTIRQLRLINGVRDGDFFLRLIRDPKQRVNRFGFTLQMISSEWCDRFYADVLPNGNVVIMGIEYEMTEWGLGKPVAFYFIKRQPRDWQYASLSQAFGIGSYNRSLLRAPIKTEDIIHYARPVDAEGTRPAPWAVSTMVKMRMLDQTELAHVIASREAACKTGFYYSDILPEGGWAEVDPPDPTTGISTEPLAPGETRPLKFGVKYQERDPKFPTSTFGEFRRAMGQSGTAGMPGADYNTLFNDLENINFSAGRLGRLDSNEMSKMIQRFDIDTAERPIFEAWLEMALITGAIALPLQKFGKFNSPQFTGRRWAQVDEVKAENASALRIANNKSNWTIECSEEGQDFDEAMMEKAENLMLMQELGIDATLTVESKPASGSYVEPETTAPASGGTGGTTKPSPTKKPGGQSNGTGKHEELEFTRA